MSDRSSRAERRAAKIRNRRILVIVLIILIVAAVLFIALGGLDKLSTQIQGAAELATPFRYLLYLT